MIPPETIGYAFIGGLLPALVWLDFILREDARCPEPRWITFIAFLFGMLAVPFVLPLEEYASTALTSGVPVIVAWATIEETMKYFAAALVLAICRKSIRNGLDLVILVLTVALGFAALENALFLIHPFAEGDVLSGILTGNLRFIGSNLLHVVASASIGFALAFSYGARPVIRMLAASAGLILAIALHAVFNFFIISQDGSKTVLAFFTVWTGAVVIFAAFEVLKYFRYRNLPANTC